MTNIDRVAPTFRPSLTSAGTQKWRSLGFFHWPVEADVLRPLVPAQLDLDAFEGQHYVGLVAFAMEDVRPAWLPRALAPSFLETNVRTYVHARGKDPGVYFFSLDAADRTAVLAARVGWGLPYFYARMSLDQNDSSSGLVRYAVDRTSGRKPSLRAEWEIGDSLGPSVPGTLEHFLLERYLLHVERRGMISTGQVHHPPYPARACRVISMNDELVGAAGIAVKGPPPIAHYAPGVDVEMFPLVRR